MRKLAPTRSSSARTAGAVGLHSGPGSQAGGSADRLSVVDVVVVECEECSRELAGDSRELRLELTDEDELDGDELVVYCVDCWEREFGTVECSPFAEFLPMGFECFL